MIARLLLGSALALPLGAACTPARDRLAAPEPDPTTAIIRANLWDGTDRPVVPGATVLVQGERILCAGAVGECVIPSGAHVIDANGQWLIPGLIDTHVHLLFLRAGSAEQGLTDDLHDLLARGVTTVRDMGTDPAALLSRVHAMSNVPRVYAMQLVAGFRFFYGRETVRTSDGYAAYRQPPAQMIQAIGWTPIMFVQDDDPDSVVAAARKVGAIGLKLYADLDTIQVRRLVEAAHRAGMPVWGHGWVQPASALEQALAGQDGIVHAAGLAGELFSPSQRDSLRGGTALLQATSQYATPASARDPRVLAALDSFAARQTFFEPTLDVTLKSVARYNAAHAAHPSLAEAYARAAVGFGMTVTREAVAHGVRITAGTDHVSYGPVRDRASLTDELALLVDSIGLSPAAALRAATRDAAVAIGGDAARLLGTIERGRYADLVLLQKSPFEDITNVEDVEWVMHDGRLLRPETLRSGIALR